MLTLVNTSAPLGDPEPHDLRGDETLSEWRKREVVTPELGVIGTLAAWIRHALKMR